MILSWKLMDVLREDGGVWEMWSLLYRYDPLPCEFHSPISVWLTTSPSFIL